MCRVGKVINGKAQAPDMDVNIEKLAAMSPSEVFETYMVPAIFAPWADALIDLTQLQPNDRFLDGIEQLDPRRYVMRTGISALAESTGDLPKS